MRFSFLFYIAAAVSLKIVGAFHRSPPVTMRRISTCFITGQTNNPSPLLAFPPLLGPLHLSDGDDNNNVNNNNNDKKTDGDNGFNSLDDFLDKPFFDPDAYDEDDPSLLGRLANFVKSDYELAETIYAGSLLVILLIMTQELLRMQLYGDHYVPFASSSSGRLF